MATRIENLFRIRSILDDPHASRPTLHRILQQELIEEQRICNALNNTGKAWSQSEYQLNLNPNEDTYEIPNTNFGKALYVLRHTGNADVPYISVPFADVARLDYNRVWLGIDGIYGGLFGVNFTPEKMAFYREGVVNAKFMVKVQPMPQTTATYTITYATGAIGTDDALASAIALPEHATLVQNRASIALLPYCSWSENAEADAMKKKEIAQSLIYQLGMDEPAFGKYIRTMNHANIVTTEAWDA